MVEENNPTDGAIDGLSMSFALLGAITTKIGVNKKCIYETNEFWNMYRGEPNYLTWLPAGRE
jgi:hypothetical protein